MQPLTDDERMNLRGSLTTLRIIVFALLTGVSVFAGYTVLLKRGQAPKPAVAPGQLEMNHAIAIGFAAAAAVIAFIVPPFIPVPKMEMDKIDPRELAIVQAASALQTRTIIACALLDGAAFFNAYWVLRDFSLANLAMVGILVFLMALHFPLAGWYYGKVERLMGVDPFESMSAYAPRKNIP